MKRKLLWINPLSHYVYEGWLYFFDKYFDLYMFDEKYTEVSFGKHQKIEYKKTYNFRTNFFNIYKSPLNLKKSAKNNIVITGDIYTNSLCWTNLNKNIIYYTEFFNIEQKLKRKILFYLTSILFRNKKIIVPTKHSYDTFKKISKKILYFPQIYYGNLFENKTLIDMKLKILFVGNIGDWKKNILFLLNSLLQLKNVNFEIGLCGKLQNFDIDKWQKVYKNKLKYHGKKSHEELNTVYTSYNVFVLPSIIDPIGAVVLEAMAHSLPVIVTKNVGASSYVQNNKNGFIINKNNSEELIEKLKILSDSKIRNEMGKESLKIVKNKHWYKNNKLLNKKFEELTNFYKL